MNCKTCNHPIMYTKMFRSYEHCWKVVDKSHFRICECRKVEILTEEMNNSHEER